jgi:hypothetical protein
MLRVLEWNSDCNNSNQRHQTVVEIKRPLKAGSLYCDEARYLLDLFANAVRELIQIHEEQFQAIVDGDSDCTRFDLLIHMANEKKYAAKYAHLHHLETHGCSTLHETNQS